jgi:tetratricopeptide (TPR) repeat protein/TolB-like protein
LISWSLALVLAAGVRTLVLPFENLSQDHDHDWRGSAFEESISSQLASAGYDVVDLKSRNRQLQEKGLGAGEPITRASAIVLAKDLGADRVVLGSFRTREDRLEVTARWIDLTRGATIGVVDDYGKVDRVYELTNQVAKNLFRLEVDEVPPGFDSCAGRRKKIPPAALEASARARASFDRTEQRQELERALTLTTDYLEARLVLGELLLDEGLARDAISVLAAAKGEGPLYERAYFDLGVAYLAAHEPKMGFEVFRNLSERSKIPAAYNNLGVALMGLQRFVEATEAFEEARRLGGETQTFLFNLGWSYWRAGKGASAFALFQKLAELDPVDAEGLWLLSASAVAQARPDLSEGSRGSALVLSPGLEHVDAATVEGWERLVASTDDVSDLTWPTASFDMEEDVVEIGELLDARDLHAQGRAAEAIQLLQRTLYRDPGASDCRRELAALYRDSGDLAQAASELEMLLWSEPSADTHVDLARVYLAMADPTRALEQLEKALALEPDHPGARGLRSEITPQ